MNTIPDTPQHLALMLRDQAKLMGDDHLASEIYTKAADKLLKLEQQVIAMGMLIPTKDENTIRVIVKMINDGHIATRNTALREAARVARNDAEAIMELVNDAT